VLMAHPSQHDCGLSGMRLSVPFGRTRRGAAGGASCDECVVLDGGAGRRPAAPASAGGGDECVVLDGGAGSGRRPAAPASAGGGDECVVLPWMAGRVGVQPPPLDSREEVTSALVDRCVGWRGGWGDHPALDEDLTTGVRAGASEL